ncbi:MAG: haloacid dehalogenase [Actinomycetota bacterium]|nr:haloacid dehalogenase [Actinomycetota bacterium]
MASARQQLAAGRCDLAGPVASARQQLAAVNEAREAGLPLCRQAIRAASSAIRAIHRLEDDRAEALIAECEKAVRGAQEVLSPHPAVAFAGFLHDAEKEYAEAVLTRALVAGAELPGPERIGVGVPAWLNGLAEAASELRRHLLDGLRRGQTDEAERLLERMEDVYEALVGVDFPDAVTGGLRRSADALRAVLERTRSDVTTTVMQLRLQAALERAAPDTAPGGPDRI